MLFINYIVYGLKGEDSTEDRETHSMQLIHKLYAHGCEKEQTTRVGYFSIGLGYTVAVADNGGMGLDFTYFSNKRFVPLARVYRDHAMERAIELLAELKHPAPLHCSMWLALVNTLNHREAIPFSERPSNDVFGGSFRINLEIINTPASAHVPILTEKDGKPLHQERKPVRLISAQDYFMASRHLKSLTKIEVAAAG